MFKLQIFNRGKATSEVYNRRSGYVKYFIHLYVNERVEKG
jgi:hypothetical protein